jgi:L-alanine-DL-glutamate epimerase-like enolase superfamily enzyme
MPGLRIDVEVERWPIDGTFVISRGARREAVVIAVHISSDTASGRGECVPYARYGETIDSVLAQIKGVDLAGFDRTTLMQRLAPGAARNALDCALWDLAAKASRRGAASLAGLNAPRPVLTCYTISLDAPEAMAAKASSVADLPLLKLKLGGGDADAARMRAVRAARPDARLVADANEAWAAADLPRLMQVAAETGMEVIEQPLPANQDTALSDVAHAVPICADESAHATSDLDALRDRYDAVNIKLDKTGGLTEALTMAARAREIGFRIMVGCMVSTSLSMAPAFLVAQKADWVDLDGPLLLARDRQPGIVYEHGIMHPPACALWG